MKRLLLPLLLLTVMGTSLPSHAASETYVAGFLGDAELNLCRQDNPSGMNIDRVCFNVAANRSYRVSIADLVQGPNVGYLYVFRDASGRCVGDPEDPLASCPNSGLTCGTQVLHSPPGARQLTILLDGPVFGPLDCLISGPGESTGMATTGTVTLTQL